MESASHRFFNNESQRKMSRQKLDAFSLLFVFFSFWQIIFINGERENTLDDFNPIPRPEEDKSFLFGKRERLSMANYNISIPVLSRMTFYCVSSLNETPSWIHQPLDEQQETIVEDGRIRKAFFPPSTWALNILPVFMTDEGYYTCSFPTEQSQTAYLNVFRKAGERIIHDDVCNGEVYVDPVPERCTIEWTYERPWFYNKTVNKCQKHSQRTCAYSGSKNLFRTLSECQDRCVSPCEEYMNRGPCGDQTLRFYYDEMTDNCKPFRFGGCKGNFNNFKTINDCVDTCMETIYRDLNTNDINIKHEIPECDSCDWKLWLHYVQKGCQPIYEHPSCCPVRFDCNTQQETTAEQFDGQCEFDGETYNANELIPLPDLCMSCPCTANFDGKYSPSCRPSQCENMQSQLDKGCVPIYDVINCCPVDWQCPPSTETSFRRRDKGSSSNEPPEKQCFYGGQGYPRGYELETHDPCVKCWCRTPPQFTCITSSCSVYPSDYTIRCLEDEHSCCKMDTCWDIRQETNRIGKPQSEGEIKICNDNPCQDNHECRVNYNECYSGSCQPICIECPSVTCQPGFEVFRSVNKCPTCRALPPVTPEDACESNPHLCDEFGTCDVVGLYSCPFGNCVPACVLPKIKSNVTIDMSHPNCPVEIQCAPPCNSRARPSDGCVDHCICPRNVEEACERVKCPANMECGATCDVGARIECTPFCKKIIN